MPSIDAIVIVGVLILAIMTTINPNIPGQLRIAEAFAITWEMILPFAISGVIALTGRTKVEFVVASGFVLVIIMLFAVWQEITQHEPAMHSSLFRYNVRI